MQRIVTLHAASGPSPEIDSSTGKRVNQELAQYLKFLLEVSLITRYISD